MKHTDRIPKSINTAWIKTKSDVFNILEMYMSTLVDNLEETPKGGTYANIVKSFPYGYRLLFLHWRFWTDVDNGGFDQFLGNTFPVDGSGQIIVDTVDGLRRLGLDELAELLQRAIAIRAAELPPLVVKALLPTKRASRTGKRAHSKAEEEKAKKLWVLDQEFSALEYSWFPKLDRYIKERPEEFVHGGWKS